MFKIECFELGEFSLMVHGGAGAPAHLSEEQAEIYHLTMSESLKRGWKLLNQGLNAWEAVLSAVEVMEESPLFNAGGPGAVLNADGHIRTDAGIMRGDTLKAGGVADLKGVLHPSKVASLVMQTSSAVLLCSEGAKRFAKEHGVEVFEDETHFVTEHRLAQLKRAQARDSDGMSTDHDSETEEKIIDKRNKIGTVGLVALDKNGTLCAVTSTGGRVNKPAGRIGDSAVPGAGFWADNKSLACSATGVGESFLMSAAAKHLAQGYSRPMTIEIALESTLKEVERFKGDGGFICITREKVGAWAYNTPAMFRGYINSEGKVKTFIV